MFTDQILLPLIAWPFPANSDGCENIVFLITTTIKSCIYAQIRQSRPALTFSSPPLLVYRLSPL